MILIEEAFINATDLTDLKLYIDENNYFIPDPNTALYDGTAAPSYVTITKSPNSVQHGASGIASTSFTAKVSGRLILQGTSAEALICETVAACNFDNADSNITVVGRVGGFEALDSTSNLHVIAQVGKSINGLVTLALSEVMTVSQLLAGDNTKAPIFAITSNVAEGYGRYYFRAGVKRADAAGPHCLWWDPKRVCQITHNINCFVGEAKWIFHRETKVNGFGSTGRMTQMADCVFEL
jgi:hypothetical protein